MKFASIMAEVTKTFFDAKANSVSYSQLKEKLDHLTRVCKAKKENGEYVYLARERFAFDEMVNAMFHHISVYDQSLVYSYNGNYYSTYSKMVPGCLSTEKLIEMKLPSNVWDSMPRSVVWVDTGIVYSEAK